MKLPMIVPVSRLRFPRCALVAFVFAVTTAAGPAGAETTATARAKGRAANATKAAAAASRQSKTPKAGAVGQPEQKASKRDSRKDEPKVASAPPLALHPLTPLAVQPQPPLPPIAPITAIPMATPTPADVAPANAGVASATSTESTGPSGQGGVGPNDSSSLQPSLLPETPDEQKVQAVIKQNAAGVRACYLRLQRGGVQITGKALVTFRISPEGRPEGLKVDAPVFSGTTLPECVVQQLSRWLFPKSQKGATFPITYPFVFVGS